MKKEKSPILAVFLSLILAGLGQLYLNQVKNAIIFFILEVSSAVLIVFVNQALGNFLSMAISILSAYYAYVDAKKTIPSKPEEHKDQKEIRVY